VPSGEDTVEAATVFREPGTWPGTQLQQRRDLKLSLGARLGPAQLTLADRGAAAGRSRRVTLPGIPAASRVLGHRLRRGEEVVDQWRVARCRHREAYLFGREFRDGHIADVRTGVEHGR